MTTHPKTKKHHPRKPTMTTPATLISVINRSSRVSDDDIARAVAAVGRQLGEHVSPFHGLVPAIEAVRTGDDPSEGGCPCYILDKPDQAGVLGYHYEANDGTQMIKIFMNPILDDSGGTVLSSAVSLSSVLSHECIELALDGPANKWVDGPDGADYAYEGCDAVQSESYVIDGVTVSDFLLQAFFDPQAAVGSRYDYLGRLAQPFSMSPGGYQITRTEPGKVTEVYGQHARAAAGGGVSVHFGPDVPEWRRAGHVWKASQKRARRRA
jgi:hypothetical protein